MHRKLLQISKKRERRTRNEGREGGKEIRREGGKEREREGEKEEGRKEERRRKRERKAK